MQVTFSTLAKRRNSTKQPTGGTTYTCKLKDSSSVLHPTIGIQWSGAGSPVAFNMCHIPTYGRYYFVSNWTYTDRIWWADCDVDPLASYKDEIGQSQKYILRADAPEDDYLMDGKYPPEFPLTHTSYALTGAPTQWATDFSGGRFIVNVVGTGNTYSAAGGSYYALTAQHLQQLITQCFTETENLWQTPVQATTNLAEALNIYGEKMSKSINNPAQFINSIYWIPFVPTLTAGGGITLGNIYTGVVGGGLTSPIHKASWSCNIPINPGDVCWQHTAPFVSYTLFFPPFGTFELDARKVWQSGSGVSGYVITDLTNGESILEVYDGANSPLFTASARLGTPIQISGSSVNYANLAQTQLNAAGGVIGSLLRGDIAGTITGGASGIISAAQAGAPSATNGGYSGGLAALQAWRGVVKTEFTVPTTDPTEQGVPIMDRMNVRVAAPAGGYVLCADGDVEAPATPEELAQIAAYLTGGFFYE